MRSIWATRVSSPFFNRSPDPGSGLCQNRPMRSLPFPFSALFDRHRPWLWFALWLSGAVFGAVLLIGQSIEVQREAFTTEARIAHRLLSQRAVQHEAVLATLSLMQPALEARLPAIYPQFLQVWRRADDGVWPVAPGLQARLRAAEEGVGGARLAMADLPGGRFWLVGSPFSRVDASAAAYALEVSLPLMVPWAEWPFGPAADAVTTPGTRVWLDYGGQQWAIHGGAPANVETGLQRFVFRKHLAAESQPFDLVAERTYRWRDLPWWALAGSVLAWSATLGVVALSIRQRQARRRAEALLRLGQVSQINALGELAAGLAHELNQPLTAVLASSQAAIRMLDEADDTSEQLLALAELRQALTQSATQARRAAEVVARLRRLIERPDGGKRQPVELVALLRGVLQLMAPECRKRGITVLGPVDGAAQVMADPVALEQIVHNLIGNALNALADTPSPTLTLSVQAGGPGTVQLRVRDNGPGVLPEVRERLFEPFVSARPGGLGLGLSLCQTLAEEMGGRLMHQPALPGAEFMLELPAAA